MLLNIANYQVRLMTISHDQTAGWWLLLLADAIFMSFNDEISTGA